MPSGTLEAVTVRHARTPSIGDSRLMEDEKMDDKEKHAEELRRSRDRILPGADERPGFQAVEIDPIIDEDGTIRAHPLCGAFGLLIDEIILGPTPAYGNRFPISDFDCIAVPGNKPSICPNADRKPQPEWMAQIEKRFRDLRLIRNDQTVHWVGSQSKVGNVCGCNFSVLSYQGHRLTE